jgi:hypothetical protein
MFKDKKKRIIAIANVHFIHSFVRAADMVKQNFRENQNVVTGVVKLIQGFSRV